MKSEAFFPCLLLSVYSSFLMFPSTTDMVLVLYLYSKISCLSWGRESGRVGTFVSHFSHSFARFLIGLLHLLRSTNCLLGRLRLKHPIKHTNTSGTVSLELCHTRQWKSSLCIYERVCACMCSCTCGPAAHRLETTRYTIYAELWYKVGRIGHWTDQSVTQDICLWWLTYFNKNYFTRWQCW